MRESLVNFLLGDNDLWVSVLFRHLKEVLESRKLRIYVCCISLSLIWYCNCCSGQLSNYRLVFLVHCRLYYMCWRSSDWRTILLDNWLSGVASWLCVQPIEYFALRLFHNVVTVDLRNPVTRPTGTSDNPTPFKVNAETISCNRQGRLRLLINSLVGRHPLDNRSYRWHFSKSV